MKFILNAWIISWLLFSLYVGIGGITRINIDEALDQIDLEKDKLVASPIKMNIGGVTVTNKYELKYATEYESLDKYFDWTLAMPKFSAYLITAMAFGTIGTIISLITEVTINGAEFNLIIWSTLPPLGMLTGLVVLGLSYILPTLIIKGGDEIRPFTLMFLCLFCGIYYKKFYRYLSNGFDKLFKKV